MACRLEQLETATGALRQAGVELDLLGGGCAHMSELSAQHGGAHVCRGYAGVFYRSGLL